MTNEERLQKRMRLGEAVEEDSREIVRLLQSCGTSSNFSPEHQQRFEELLEHRRQLLAQLLETL